MIEKYDLISDTLPTIPTPHDCIIKEIELNNEELIIRFEDDISHYDSIQYYRPTAISLIMRIHLVDPVINIYKYKKMRFKEGYLMISSKKFINTIQKSKMVYLYHLVSYQSILLQLHWKGWYWLEITADTIELEWVEK